MSHLKPKSKTPLLKTHSSVTLRCDIAPKTHLKIKEQGKYTVHAFSSRLQSQVQEMGLVHPSLMGLIEGFARYESH